jgi:hypothetical protein
MLPQWLCGRERLNAWTDVVRIVRPQCAQITIKRADYATP